MIPILSQTFNPIFFLHPKFFYQDFFGPNFLDLTFLNNNNNKTTTTTIEMALDIIEINLVSDSLLIHNKEHIFFAKLSSLGKTFLRILDPKIPCFVDSECTVWAKPTGVNFAKGA